mgnify:FL=1
MKIEQFVKKYENHPVLFAGTGISLRYLKNSYSWETLLRKICFDIKENDEFFLNLKNKYYDSTTRFCDYAKLAEELEVEFNKILIDDRNGKFKEINDEFFKLMEQNNNTSRLKIYISKILNDLTLKEEMNPELEKMKKIRKNISCIITTNYDCLLENIFEFGPLIGNDIMMSNPYGAIYKIHGSVNSPEQIIITESDYNRFENKYELIRAQLLSLFIHNPIIFMGYSISDSNIKKILKTIFDYVDVNTELAKKIRNNFLLVEYDANSDSDDVMEYDIVIDNIRICINRIKTNNFGLIYDEIEKLKLPISAMDIRKVQAIVNNIYSGSKNAPRVMITENLNDLKNSDMVLAIGTDKTIKYEFRTISEMMSEYFNILEESNSQLLELIDKQFIQNQQYFPIFAFSKINNRIVKTDILKQNQITKVKMIIQKIDANSKKQFGSVQEIMKSDVIPLSRKNETIIWNFIHNHLRDDDVKAYLQNYDIKTETDYRKLLCVYDLIKYGNNYMKEILKQIEEAK